MAFQEHFQFVWAQQENNAGKKKKKERVIN